MQRRYYLKKNVAIEPLIARYRSSPYLISPCSAPRFLRYLIRKLLKSFIQSPRAHEMALQNPLMQGGPFLMLSSEQQADAQKFFGYQSENIKVLLDAADDLDKFYFQLKLAQGEPLDNFLENIPHNLSGLVELFYERSGHASYKIIEGLAYRSSLYNESLQEILLYALDTDSRDFVLTTPRLEKIDRIFLKIPHSHPAIDDLARARVFPVSSIQSIAYDMGVSKKDYELFESHFEISEDENRIKYSEIKNLDAQSDLRTRYFGHACVEISTSCTSILIDPLISYGIPSINDQRLTFLDLPERINTLIITHLHLDHFCIETLMQIRNKTDVIIIPKSMGGKTIDPSPKWILQAIGYKNIIELDSMESYRCNDLTVTALPFHGEHGCLDISGKSTFLISSKFNKILFAADIRTADEGLLNKIANAVGDIDTIFVGMESEGAPLSWVYGSLLDVPIERKWDQQRRLNGSDAKLAMHLVRYFSPKRVRIYALGREPWLSHIMRVNLNKNSVGQNEINSFSLACQEMGLDIKTLYISSIEQYSKNRHEILA